VPHAGNGWEIFVREPRWWKKSSAPQGRPWPSFYGSRCWPGRCGKCPASVRETMRERRAGTSTGSSCRWAERKIPLISELRGCDLMWGWFPIRRQRHGFDDLVSGPPSTWLNKRYGDFVFHPVGSKLKCPVFVASEMSGFRVVPSPVGLGWFWGWGCRGRGQIPFPCSALQKPCWIGAHRLHHSDPGNAVRGRDSRFHSGVGAPPPDNPPTSPASAPARSAS